MRRGRAPLGGRGLHGARSPQCVDNVGATAHLWIPQPAAAPSPADIAAYLLQQGYRFQDAGASWALYAQQIAGEKVTLVPQKASALDYARVVAMRVEDVARLEERAPSVVLRDMKAASVDVVRLAIEGSSTRDGRIPVEAGRRVYDAARDLLLAAACSVIDPRPAFAKRKPEDAMSLLSRARFGQTEVGSFVLAIECNVPPRLQQSFAGLDSDDDAPLEGKASIRLARALHAAEVATRASAAAGRIEPFLEAIKEGVSANLCEAIAEVLDATGADALRAGFSFAPSRPLVATVPRATTFSADTSPILREAAAQLRAEATFPAIELLGTVVKLDSPDPDAGGDAVIRADLDGRVRDVRVALGAKGYQRAIAAHGSRSLVRCTGDVAREGRSWVLRDARDFAPVSNADEA